MTKAKTINKHCPTCNAYLIPCDMCGSQHGDEKIYYYSKKWYCHDCLNIIFELKGIKQTLGEVLELISDSRTLIYDVENYCKQKLKRLSE